ncbi:MAG: hypothetical protein WAO12_07170 [Venatoribacter sp.]
MPITPASESTLLAKIKQLHNQYLEQANEYDEYVRRNEAQQFHDDYTQAIADTTEKFVEQLAALINEFEANNNHER